MANIPERKQIIFYAEVLSTKDPMKLGRVQVKLNSLDKAVEMPWIRMIQAQASSKSKGTMILPEEKDTVVVLRGAGDHIGSMLILGGVYDKKNKPDFGKNLDKNDYKFFQSREGHLLLVSDEDGKTKIEVKTAKGLHLLMDDKAKCIDIKAEAVTLKMDGKGKAFKVESPDVVMIKGKDITIKGDGAVVIEGKTVSIKGAMGVDIKGKDVAIKADMNAKLDGLKIAIKAGATCDVQGGAKVAVKGAMTNIG